MVKKINTMTPEEIKAYRKEIKQRFFEKLGMTQYEYNKKHILNYQKTEKGKESQQKKIKKNQARRDAIFLPSIPDNDENTNEDQLKDVFLTQSNEN